MVGRTGRERSCLSINWKVRIQFSSAGISYKRRLEAAKSIFVCPLTISSSEVLVPVSEISITAYHLERAWLPKK